MSLLCSLLASKPVGSPRPCPICGGRVPAGRTRPRIYCSQRCKNKVNNIRYGADPEFRERKKAISRGRHRREEQRACPWCDATFRVGGASGALRSQRYCSPECAHRTARTAHSVKDRSLVPLAQAIYLLKKEVTNHADR